VTITDEANRSASEQALAGLDRTVVTGQDNTNALRNTFSIQEIQAGFDVTKAFGQEVGTFLSNKAAKIDAANKALKEEKAKPEGQWNQEKIAQLEAQLNDAATWAPGGTSRQILTALTAAASGNVTGTSTQLIQNTFVSLIQQKGAAFIGELVHGKDGQPGVLKEGSPEHAALHAIIAAAGSAASGQDAFSGAAGTAASSLLTNLFDNNSLGKTEEEKEANRNLLLTLVAGLSEGTGMDNTAALQSALAALDNNANLSLMDQPKAAIEALSGNRGNGSPRRMVEEWRKRSALSDAAKVALADTLEGVLADLQMRGVDLRTLTVADMNGLIGQTGVGLLPDMKPGEIKALQAERERVARINGSTNEGISFLASNTSLFYGLPVNTVQLALHTPSNAISVEGPQWSLRSAT